MATERGDQGEQSPAFAQWLVFSRVAEAGEILARELKPQNSSMYEKIQQKALDSKSTMCSGDKKKEGVRWTSESHYQFDVGAFSVALLCTTLCNLMDCSLPGSSVRGISQGRILEWVAISLPTGFTRPRDQTQDSHTGLSHQRMGLGQVWDFKLETWKTCLTQNWKTDLGVFP